MPPRSWQIPATHAIVNAGLGWAELRQHALGSRALVATEPVQQDLLWREQGLAQADVDEPGLRALLAEQVRDAHPVVRAVKRAPRWGAGCAVPPMGLRGGASSSREPLIAGELAPFQAVVPPGPVSTFLRRW